MGEGGQKHRHRQTQTDTGTETQRHRDADSDTSTETTCEVDVGVDAPADRAGELAVEGLHGRRPELRAAACVMTFIAVSGYSAWVIHV